MRVEQIGDATLYLGDCLEVLPTLGQVDAVVTSPPYAQQRDYNGKMAEDWRCLVSGCLSGFDSGAQLLVNLGLIHKDGEVCAYWNELIADMGTSGWRLFGWYVWDQMNGMAGQFGGRLAPSFEFVFHFNKTAPDIRKTKPTKGGVIHGPNYRNRFGQQPEKTGRGQEVQAMKIPDSVIRVPREMQGGVIETAHPARFPVRLANELINPFSHPGQTICDPFMGSGTTGVAAIQLGRKFIGIEIDPDYFSIACRRIEEAWKQPRLFEEPKAKPAPAPNLFDGDAA